MQSSSRPVLALLVAVSLLAGVPLVPGASVDTPAYRTPAPNAPASHPTNPPFPTTDLGVGSPATTGEPANESESAVTHADIGSERILAAMDAREQVVPWGVAAIGGPAASNYTRRHRRGGPPTVAIVDSGVNASHPDLRGQVVWGANTLGVNTGDGVRYGVEAADDWSGHGTAVAGIVAARDDDRGIVGVAPDARLYAVRATARRMNGQASVSRAFVVAAKGPDRTLGTADDPDVVVTALGYDWSTPSLLRATKRASENAVVVAAVGNEGDGNVSTTEFWYPAGYAFVTGVGMTGLDGGPVVASSESDRVAVSAPGRFVLTTFNGSYGFFTGTSAAAPHVAGVAALMADVAGNHSGAVLGDGRAEEILRATARDVGTPGYDRETGAGIVDAPAAVERARNETQAYRPPPVLDRVPTDPDGDGVFEDVTGDGRVDLLDVQALYRHVDDPVVTDHADRYDLTGDGGVDLLDVQALFDAGR